MCSMSLNKLLGGLVMSSIIAASAAPLAASGDQTAKKVAVAPADEYFGRMKMSILGIRNEIHDLTLKIGFEPACRSWLYLRARAAVQQGRGLA